MDFIIVLAAVVLLFVGRRVPDAARRARWDRAAAKGAPLETPRPRQPGRFESWLIRMGWQVLVALVISFGILWFASR